MRRALVAALRVLAVVGVVIAMVTVRVVWSSRTELHEAEERAAAGDATMALDHYGRAARLYAPANPFSTRAIEKLRAACDTPDASDTPGAMETSAQLGACRELRSAILATRSFYTPHESLLLHANATIAEKSARLESPSVDPGADEAARVRWHAAELARDEAPNVAYSILAIVGLLSWIGCAIGFFLAGLDERDRPRRPAGYLWAAGILAGFSLFIVGLGRA